MLGRLLTVGRLSKDGSVLLAISAPLTPSTTWALKPASEAAREKPSSLSGRDERLITKTSSN